MRGHAVILASALAWFISIESAEAKLDILVDKATQRMMVIQDGYIRYMWPVSTGRDNMATPNGVYTPQRLERNWFSTAYYDSPMPFSIFFHNGYAIHGSYAIDRLGGPASHGCVRLHPHHAAILSTWCNRKVRRGRLSKYRTRDVPRSHRCRGVKSRWDRGVTSLRDQGVTSLWDQGATSLRYRRARFPWDRA